MGNVLRKGKSKSLVNQYNLLYNNSCAICYVSYKKLYRISDINETICKRCKKEYYKWRKKNKGKEYIHKSLHSPVSSFIT